MAVGDETLRRFKFALEPFGGTWVLLPGNHDPATAESPWSRLKRLTLPDNVIIADEPVPVVLGDKVAILPAPLRRRRDRSEEHTSELQSLMRISYAVFCLKKKRSSNHQVKSSTKINQ